MIKVISFSLILSLLIFIGIHLLQSTKSVDFFYQSSGNYIQFYNHKTHQITCHVILDNDKVDIDIPSQVYYDFVPLNSMGQWQEFWCTRSLWQRIFL